jgi:hypothetical protein
MIISADPKHYHAPTKFQVIKLTTACLTLGVPLDDALNLILKYVRDNTLITPQEASTIVHSAYERESLSHTPTIPVSQAHLNYQSMIASHTAPDQAFHESGLCQALTPEPPPWRIETDYHTDDLALHDGRIYQCLQDHISNYSPNGLTLPLWRMI